MEKACGVRFCTNTVDVSCDGNSLHCTVHMTQKACGVYGCTDTVPHYLHKKTKYCFEHRRSNQCTHRGCCEFLLSKEEKEAHLCIDHIEGSAVLGSSKRSTGKGKVECRQEGCPKLAVGETGCCAAHSKQCQQEGCSAIPQRKTSFCYGHQPKDLLGKTSTQPDCQKIGCNNKIYVKLCHGRYCHGTFCRTHSGRIQCKYGECRSAAVSGGLVGLCKTHGGGKRCQYTECGKSARSNTSEYCVGHGGGKRCQIESCNCSARNATDFCRKHRRAVVEI